MAIVRRVLDSIWKFGSSMQLHKGHDLLIEALKIVSAGTSNVRLIIFGKKDNKDNMSNKMPFPVDYLGHLHDQLSLRTLYSAADLLLVPSRQESFGQTASEAQACGTPVVAFNTGGLRDIVEHKVTGYLAKPFSVQDLAHGIKWTLSESLETGDEIDCERNKTINEKSRERAEELFSYKSTAQKYINTTGGRGKTTGQLTQLDKMGILKLLNKENPTIEDVRKR